MAMQAANHLTSSRAEISRKSLIGIGLGGLAGAAVGYGLMTWTMKIVPPRSLTWSDFVALTVGFALVPIGIFMACLSVNRKQLAKALEGPIHPHAETSDNSVQPATNAEVKQAVAQAVVLILAGVLLLVPVLAQGQIKANALLAGYFYAGIFVLFVVQSIMNIQLWRTGDEFFRRTLLIISAVTFAIGQSILFLYAAAERMHLLPAINSWDVITLLLSLYLLVNFFVGLRQRSQA
jgi:large-conductance mechanosensitive channel